jgi:hypothetical protein
VLSERNRDKCGTVERTHSRDEVLLLVNIRDVRLFHLLADDLGGVDDVTGCRTPRDRIKGCTVKHGIENPAMFIDDRRVEEQPIRSDKTGSASRS